MFNSKEKSTNTKPAYKATTTMERNVIAKNTLIEGCDIKSEGDFRIDGTIKGTLTTKGRVIIGVDGLVEGTVDAANADIEGKFSGKLNVHKTLTIKSTANISGDVVISKLSVEPGATFNATCNMKGAVKELNQKTENKAEKTA